MDLLNNNLIKFDFYMPMFNWFFPYAINKRNQLDNGEDFYLNFESNVKNRSLYFHIPFCQDICAFCPFTREVCHDSKKIDKYLDALIKEIEIKTKNEGVKKFPISSIFVGGGTPSILSAEQIIRFGNAIKRGFNLEELKEFSFEMNAKTVTEDRVKALKKIGVTHARMGVQSFNKKYRDLFCLSATLDQIKNGAKLLNDYFDYVCVDLLYGMHGQTIDDFLSDLKQIITLNTPTIDVYPINNIVTQNKLDGKYRDSGLKPITALEKLMMNLILRDYMLASGYLPHNGHGYIKSTQEEIRKNEVVTDKYTFQYHETVYGYKGSEVLGFGCCALSLLDSGYTVTNNNNINEYINDLLEKNSLKIDVYKYSPDINENKGISLHLPYHGIVNKSEINYDKVDKSILRNLNRLITENLVVEDDNHYKLTRLGWLWYVDILYLLSPENDKTALFNRILTAQKNGKIKEEEWKINF